MSINHRPTLPRPVSDHFVRLQRNSVLYAPDRIRAAIDCLRILYYRGLLDEDLAVQITHDQFHRMVLSVPEETRHVADAIRFGCVNSVRSVLDHEEHLFEPQVALSHV